MKRDVEMIGSLVGQSAFEGLEAFALNQTPLVGCRTLDVLHVAAAQLIGTTEFCTFDAHQSSLAARLGLTAVSP